MLGGRGQGPMTMSRPSSLPPLLLLLSAYLPLTTAAPSLTDDSQCGCYLTNGSADSFFTAHKFFDFRSLDQYQGVPDPISDPFATADASLTSPFFTTTSWNSSWSIQSWNNSGSAGSRSDATVLRVNSPNNVYIERNANPPPDSPKATYLTLRTQRMAEFQSAAELESNSAGYHFLSVRMLARTLGSAGAVTALFTYRKPDPGAPTDAVQEADLEVITHDPPGLVHYTNQPSVSAATGDVVANATQNVTLPGGLQWSDWAVHRLDWTPTQSTWYVDGTQTANISFQVPRDAAQLVLNAWSDGGQWTGNMSVGDAAFLQIQWLEMVYNSTDDTKKAAEGPGCKGVCSVDETSKTGTPVMLWTSGAAGSTGVPGSPGGAKTGAGSRLAGWMPLGMVLGMVYMSF